MIKNKLFNRAILTALLLALIVNSLAGCQSTAPILEPGSYYTQEDVQKLLDYSGYVAQPSISEALLDKYPEADFLFKNECMSFYRDMDHFVGSNMQSPLSSAVRNYPPQIVRTINSDTLYMKDFSGLSVGDRMERVEEIDPITSLYKEGYDRITDETLEAYLKGGEFISTVHLLKDGIIRIDYERVTCGEYYIKQIFESEDFIIPVLGGELCYRIYDEDYI